MAPPLMFQYPMRGGTALTCYDQKVLSFSPTNYYRFSVNDPLIDSSGNSADPVTITGTIGGTPLFIHDPGPVTLTANGSPTNPQIISVPIFGAGVNGRSFGFFFSPVAVGGAVQFIAGGDPANPPGQPFIYLTGNSPAEVAVVINGGTTIFNTPKVNGGSVCWIMLSEYLNLGIKKTRICLNVDSNPTTANDVNGWFSDGIGTGIDIGTRRLIGGTFDTQQFTGRISTFSSFDGGSNNCNNLSTPIFGARKCA